MKTELTEQETKQIYINMFIESVNNIPIEILNQLISQIIQQQNGNTN